jgi:nucleoid DNA-binding protein
MYCWTIISYQLKPVKRKQLVAKTANEMELPVELVDDVVKFFYGELNKTLIACEDIAIEVPKLGTFVVKYKSLDHLIHHTEAKIPYYRNMGTMRSYQYALDNEQALVKYNALREVLEKERKRKEEIKQKRWNHETKSDTRLEE